MRPSVSQTPHPFSRHGDTQTVAFWTGRTDWAVASTPKIKNWDEQWHSALVFLTLKVTVRIYLHGRTEASVGGRVHEAVEQTLIELSIKQQAADDPTGVGRGGTVEHGVWPDVDTQQGQQRTSYTRLRQDTLPSVREKNCKTSLRLWLRNQKRNTLQENGVTSRQIRSSPVNDPCVRLIGAGDVILRHQAW